VRILLRLRKESATHPAAPPGQDDGARMENIEKVLGSDITSENSQSVGAVEDLKLNEQRGNVIENKGSSLENRVQSGNIIENKCTYAQNAGMLLKRKGVIGNAELRATSKWPSALPVSDDAPCLR
jgi:sporulation protein YlmC with PRC-barrel domain